ncbi:MAG: chromosomal replication initiator protein DnaA [Candidatus Omnitrophota bacterium]|nr:chromosomal replication initiator protein DnaA [Candidatus Omnitrophota bacterium]
MILLLEAWEQAQNYLKDKLGETSYAAWILPLKPRIEKNTLILGVPDNFFKEWVENHYRNLIVEAIKQVVNEEEFEILLEVSSQNNEPADKTALPQPIKTQKIETSSFNLNSRYIFENFVVGPSNRHAHAYALAVAESPAKIYNPLFIYGATGLGKTHLIQAICHHIIHKTNGAAKICYIPSERFTNELINAIQHKTTLNFRQKYRNVDVLVIDDTHFIAGKESTQEEFFHTFNALYDSHKQIILSSDRPPKEITDLQERLISRFGWGLTTDIQPPDLETRVAILKKKIERESICVPNDAIFFIAQLIKSNIRDLEGALVRTIAYSLLEERPITIDLTKEVLKDLLKEPKKLITIDFIQRCVAEEFGLPPYELKTKHRNKTVVLPRQIAMYLSRELTDLSFPEIGGYFGGKDHTTVLHSCNKIKKELVIKEDLKNRVEKIIHLIKQ